MIDRDPTDRVLEFWFETGTVPGLCEFRPIWFARDDAFDAAINERFPDEYARAAAGRLDRLARSARGALALVILLDQFPRNLFRGTGQAFATDGEARSIARRAIETGLTEDLSPLRKIFLYLPFQHSEDLADQQWSVRLFQSLGDDKVVRWIQDAADRHLEIIERFGRFPHRNAALNRPSTAAEHAFLESPSGAFWTA